MPYGTVFNDPSALVQLAHGVIESIVRGDCDMARRFFHPEATVTGQQDGMLVRCDVAGYMEFCRRLRLPRRNVGERYQVILAETAGQSGFVKLHETYPEGDLVSYMTASRVSGQWLVNNRTFYGASKMVISAQGRPYKHDA